MAQTEIPFRPSAPPRTAPTQAPWLAIALLVLGAGAALLALLGPLFGLDVIRYHVSEGAVDQIVGGDVAALFLVAPASVVAGLLVWRGHCAGPVVALGPAFYAMYMYSQLALGGDVIRYEGTSERFFVLYLGLFVIAGAVAIRSWTQIDADHLPVNKKWVDRTLGIFLLVVAFFLTVGLHLPGLLDVWSSEPTSQEYLADPFVFWLVKFMDLGLVIPVLLLVGVGVLRNLPWSRKAMYGVAGWVALLGSSVAGMAIAMEIGGDPAATFANTIAFSVFAIVGFVVTFTIFRTLFSPQTPTVSGSGPEA